MVEFLCFHVWKIFKPFWFVLGTLAAKYEKLGGEVKWMGKPDKVIRSFCSSYLLHIFLCFLISRDIYAYVIALTNRVASLLYQPYTFRHSTSSHDCQRIQFSVGFAIPNSILRYLKSHIIHSFFTLLNKHSTVSNWHWCCGLLNKAESSNQVGWFGIRHDYEIYVGLFPNLNPTRSEAPSFPHHAIIYEDTIIPPCFEYL